MQFAKVFNINGTQLLCLLQPRDEDGLPEMKMVTYIGNTCVVFGNRLVPPGAQALDPAAVLAKTQAMFDEFGEAQAKQAYEVAQQVIADAQRTQASQVGRHESAMSDEDATNAPSGEAQPRLVTDADFGVPLVSVALH